VSTNSTTWALGNAKVLQFSTFSSFVKIFSFAYYPSSNSISTHWIQSKEIEKSKSIDYLIDEILNYKFLVKAIK